ncbi:LysR family transcriptional regulator [Bordetella sp. BOR01]|uniref:LysR family transcriptional regulator n=1 Tax=Bordetella sp. BOR01 TaxID=2854779 RepID=UPI001C43B307|nr:LysR family transcriptional regulator [Bordetella sp. BOR01]MBV7485077.1 LysR family transcriptional regulator [Bordetella sp. BOR01]
MFEFRLVRQFVVVAEELNFRRAAERLHMSQPPLSTAMQNLEADIGTALLDRSKHHVRLTPAGQIFYRDAIRLLQFAEQSRERARRTGSGLEGALRLSFVPSAALDVLPEIFKRFQLDYPTVQLTLTAETTRRQLEDVHNGHSDLALLVGPLYDSRGLELVGLRPQHFVIAVPIGHPLAKRQKVKMKELAAEPFVSFPAAEGTGFVSALLGACQAAGFMPRVVQEASQMQAILTLVAGGLGIALVPSSMRRLHMEDVCFLEIAEPRNPPTYQLVFAYGTGNDNPVIQAFLASALGSAHPAGNQDDGTDPA